MTNRDKGIREQQLLMLFFCICVCVFGLGGRGCGRVVPCKSSLKRPVFEQAANYHILSHLGLNYSRTAPPPPGAPRQQCADGAPWKQPFSSRHRWMLAHGVYLGRKRIAKCLYLFKTVVFPLWSVKTLINVLFSVHPGRKFNLF